MKTQMSSRRRGPCHEPLSTLFALIVLAAAGLSASCGGGGTHKLSGNTNVTLVMSSTANDQLDTFSLQLQSLTMTDQSGNTVTLVSALQPTEFIHVNGGIEPLLTVTIPQGMYTSASAVVGNSVFICATLTNSGSIETSSFGDVPTPPAGVSVNLPEPIRVTGASMALDLNLDVQNSFSLASCDVTDHGATYSITPTFSLTAASFSAQATNPANGKAIGIDGEVSSVNAANDSFVVAYTLDEAPRTVSVSTGAGTVFQGINSFAGLAAGTFVNLDGVVQSDGSLAATRIAVEDPAATSVEIGPVLFVSNAIPVLEMIGQQEQGVLTVGGANPFDFENTAFQISGEIGNLNSLPFTPMFDAASMVAGQNVYLTTTATAFGPQATSTAAQTVTLMPQIVDGTISGTSMAGNFTVYTVNLAPYDLFPTLAVQDGQTTALNNSSEMQVYVDSSAQMLNSQALAVNGTFRFYGLVFNDHGTLRMDCAQVNDGVSLTPPAAPMAANSRINGRASIVSNKAVGGQRAVNVVVTPAK